MKHMFLTGCKWLVPLLFLILGTVIYFLISSHRFMGIIFWGIAVIIGLYQLLAVWERSSRMQAKAVRTVLTVLLILASLAAVVTLGFILPGHDAAENAACEYVVVLGAGVKGNTPSRILQDRIDKAYEYLSANPDVICIASGGKGNGEDISEAQCIFDHLTARGIDADRIWLEDRSTSTVENFKYTLELLRTKTGDCPEEICVISNEFHLYRASLIAKNDGVDAHCISADTSWLTLRINYTLREIFALWKYLIVGG